MAQKKYTVAETGPRIEEFLKHVLKLAGFQLAFTVAEGETPHPDFENPDLMVRFTGADVDLLLDNKAELLLALEQLTMEAIGMAPEEHSRICFDANDRRILRIEELRMSAQTAAERVKKSRQPFHFSPMNSRERRILHLALRDETDIRSESVGEGPIRQVVIVPAEMKTLPEPVIPPKPRPELDSTGGRPGGFRGRGGRDGERRGGPPSRGGPRGPRRDHAQLKQHAGYSAGTNPRHDCRGFDTAGTRRHRHRAYFRAGCAFHRRSNAAICAGIGSRFLETMVSGIGGAS